MQIDTIKYLAYTSIVKLSRDEVLLDFILEHLSLVLLAVMIITVLVHDHLQEQIPSHHISPQELVLMMAKSHVAVIDLRNLQAFDSQHIKSAKQKIITLPLEAEPRLKKLNNYVFYCQDGRHSNSVVNALREEGYSANLLVGGIDAWTESGFLTTQPTKASKK